MRERESKLTLSVSRHTLKVQTLTSYLVSLCTLREDSVGVKGPAT